MKRFILLLLLNGIFCFSAIYSQDYQQIYNDAANCQKKGDFYQAIKKFQAASISATPDQKKDVDRRIDQCANELNSLVEKVKKEKLRADDLLAKSNELLRGLVPDTVKLLSAYFSSMAGKELEYCRFESALRYLRFAKLSPDLPANKEQELKKQVENCENLVKYNVAATNFYRTFNYAKAEAEYQKILLLLPSDSMIIKRIAYCKNPVFKKENLVEIKGGTYTMGDGEYTDNTKHQVTLTGFKMYKYEITNEEYVEFLTIYGSDRVLEGEYKDEFMIDYGDWGIIKEGKLWESTDNYGNSPAIRVSWFGAMEFCKFWHGNLPTEAQWEYAARSGGKEVKYSWGNEEPGTKKVANMADESYFTKYSGSYTAGYDDGYVTTSPVGSFDGNESGLFDMSGNVYEWCEDWYNKDFYGNSENKTNPVNESKTAYRVLRGGSWHSDARYCCVAYRGSNAPGIRHDIIGFRLVIVP